MTMVNKVEDKKNDDRFEQEEERGKHVYQWPPSDAEGLECSEGGCWPRTEANEWEGVCVVSGVGDVILPIAWSGEGVPSVLREIFSLRTRSLLASSSTATNLSISSFFSCSSRIM